MALFQYQRCSVNLLPALWCLLATSPWLTLSIIPCPPTIFYSTLGIYTTSVQNKILFKHQTKRPSPILRILEGRCHCALVHFSPQRKLLWLSHFTKLPRREPSNWWPTNLISLLWLIREGKRPSKSELTFRTWSNCRRSTMASFEVNRALPEWLISKHSDEGCLRWTIIDCDFLGYNVRFWPRISSRASKKLSTMTRNSLYWCRIYMEFFPNIFITL